MPNEVPFLALPINEMIALGNAGEEVVLDPITPTGPVRFPKARRMMVMDSPRGMQLPLGIVHMAVVPKGAEAQPPDYALRYGKTSVSVGDMVVLRSEQGGASWTFFATSVRIVPD